MPTPAPTLLDAGGGGISWGDIPWVDIASVLIAALALILSFVVYRRQGKHAEQRREDEQERMRVDLKVEVNSYMRDPNGPRVAVIKCVNLKPFDVPISVVWLEQEGRIVSPSTTLHGQHFIPGTISARDMGRTIIEESAVLNQRIDPYKPVVAVVFPTVGGKFESAPTVLGKRRTRGLEDLLIGPQMSGPS